MNVMWYTHLFSSAFEQFAEGFGFGEAYFRANHTGSFALETHVRYLSEVRIGQHVTVRSRLLGRSEKRIHFMHFMTIDETGALAAIQEHVGAHIDMRIRRMAPLPSDIAARFDKLLAEQERPRLAGPGVRRDEAVGAIRKAVEDCPRLQPLRSWQRFLELSGGVEVATAFFRRHKDGIGDMVRLTDILETLGDDEVGRSAGDEDVLARPGRFIDDRPFPTPDKAAISNRDTSAARPTHIPTPLDRSRSAYKAQRLSEYCGGLPTVFFFLLRRTISTGSKPLRPLS